MGRAFPTASLRYRHVPAPLAPGPSSLLLICPTDPSPKPGSPPSCCPCDRSGGPSPTINNGEQILGCQGQGPSSQGCSPFPLRPPAGGPGGWAGTTHGLERNNQGSARALGRGSHQVALLATLMVQPRGSPGPSPTALLLEEGPRAKVEGNMKFFLCAAFHAYSVGSTRIALHGTTELRTGAGPHGCSAGVPGSQWM